jgi:hypothetical protein
MHIRSKFTNLNNNLNNHIRLALSVFLCENKDLSGVVVHPMKPVALNRSKSRGRLLKWLHNPGNLHIKKAEPERKR